MKTFPDLLGHANGCPHKQAGREARQSLAMTPKSLIRGCATTLRISRDQCPNRKYLDESTDFSKAYFVTKLAHKLFRAVAMKDSTTYKISISDAIFLFFAR